MGGVRALRESELQETQLTRDKQRNGHQEANEEKAAGSKPGERGIREVKEDMPMTKHRMSPETLEPHESGLQ